MGGFDVTTLILPVGLLALMYFVMIRPQQQAMRKRQAMLSDLRSGDEVVTIGGLHGSIVAIDDKTVRLKVASGVELTFNRTAIGSKRDAAE